MLAKEQRFIKTHFPTRTWLGLKELALPELLIEIELEVYKNEESNKH